jgi:hypothetical protein
MRIEVLFTLIVSQLDCKRMRKLSIQISILILLQLTVPTLLAAQKNSDYGPEVKSFLQLMRHEEDELEFQIKHNEISRRDYARSMAQIAIHRQTVLDLVKETGEDNVPELHVVTTAEVDQLIEDGTRLLKTIKRGELIGTKWRYLGSVHRGEVFYIFERLSVR